MFIPLYDHNSMRHLDRPYVTWLLILINLGIFVFTQGMGYVALASSMTYSYGLIPSVVMDLKDLAVELQSVPDSATLVTYGFLHADFMHLAGNMLFLWVFGDNVEDAMGHIRFLLFYLFCVAAGGAAYALSNWGSDTPLIGASGAVAGVVAAYLMLHPKVQIWVLALGRIPLRLSARWVLGAWVLYQIVNALALNQDNVAWSAHVGGMLCGAVLIVFLRRRGVALFDRDLV